MTRNAIISEINNLYDENIELKVKNENLLKQIENFNKCELINKEENIKIDTLLNKLVDYGKEKLFDEVIRNGYGSNLNVTEDEKTKEIKTTSLDNWLEGKMYTYNIPDNMSKEDIKNILCDKINELYNKEKAKAIIEYKKEKDLESKE